ncbi:leucine-rich repeat serine/threonine-protein kinase 1 [Lingula anatina]|uniref:non-specific serine/threonine protein kinase n=1 Tax=Lingula anatina TaxID=7574 RepID=A0A2R2MKQ6_LINAN|nr:leucine-rich repeat serine/threonine-protein kinase 1 [Lingula anatina]|eukprot:XP_023930801.1 leucine-rich repeat serine/threonine-protein kinase 1 [Lingula anatina]
MIDTLLERRPELGSNMDWCSCMLYVACKGGHLPAVKKWVDLAKQQKIDLKQPLQIVSESDDEECPSHERTPLYAACLAGHPDVADYLMYHDAEVTPFIAAKFEHFIKDLLYMPRYVQENKVQNQENEGNESDDQVEHNIRWMRKGLQTLPLPWIQPFLHTVITLDLSHNGLKQLPSCLPWSMPNLHSLNISNNDLRSFDTPTEYLCSKLQVINLANNLLSGVPIQLYQVSSLQKLHLSHNRLQCLYIGCAASPYNSLVIEDGHPEATRQGKGSSIGKMNCPSLKLLDLSHNLLEEIPAAIQDIDGLQKLNVAHNSLLRFPKPWGCRLDYLDLSHNNLVLLPPNFNVFWDDTLKVLKLNNNELEALTEGIFKLKSLEELDLSFNKLEYLPKPDLWTLGSLKNLNLSHNNFGYQTAASPTESRSPGKVFERFKELYHRHRTGTNAPASNDYFMEFPPGLRETLCYLDLSHNHLPTVPSSVCRLERLERLNIRGNPIKELPLELGNLLGLWHFKVEKSQLQNLPPHLWPQGTQDDSHSYRCRDLLHHCRLKLRKSEPNRRIKMMVVGREERGKSCLIAALQGKPLPKPVATNGIHLDNEMWNLRGSQFKKLFKDKKNLPNVEIAVWDCAGQEDFYTTHQCFVTPNALYLVVWKLVLHEQGVDNIRQWLLNIESRAPGSTVIIVGTHLDQLDKGKRADKIVELTDRIQQLYGSHGYPKIAHVQAVSSTSKDQEGIRELREKIYMTAVTMGDVHCRSERWIGKMIPRSYLDLQRIVEAVEQNESQVPVLDQDQFNRLLSQVPNSDINTDEDVELAVKYLHEAGVLLHYPDQLRQLNSLYFIDPRWLCDMLANVITIKAVNPKVKDGILKIQDLKAVLKHDPRFPMELLDQYIQLMERFDIAIKLDSDNLLLPSKLPILRPGVTLEQSNCLHRFYKMSFIPSGFWSRLVTRLIISVRRLLSSLERTKRPLSTRGQSEISKPKRKLARTVWNATMRRRDRGGLIIKRQQIFYWRQGFIVTFRGGYMSVESTVEEAFLGGHAYDCSGVLITVHSTSDDFASMGFVTDEIETLIMEWFPGLLQADIQRLIPCPKCWDGGKQDVRRTSTLGNNFSLEYCAMKAYEGKTHLVCPVHPKKVKVHNLIPDLLLTDLPENFLLDGDYLIKEDFLSKGGTAMVFKGLYKGKAVAIKEFFSGQNASEYTQSSGSEDSGRMTFQSGVSTWQSTLEAADDTTSTVSGVETLGTREQEILEWRQMAKGAKIVQAFKEVRQEVMLLSKLKHPNVLSLIGVCFNPLCFVMEYAPYGSLTSVLHAGDRENLSDDVQGQHGMVFNKMFTYKLLLQVAEALFYLHSKDVIYRDLKSDNILVWSLRMQDAVNVKVSDYGISTYLTPSGVIGNEGTPGFQAPEVRTGVTYDEKVDLFSFAMLIYETLTGLRPFGQRKSLSSITYAVRKGEKPDLKGIDMKMQMLQDLMVQCWNNEPQCRPTAEHVVDVMKDVKFICLNSIFPQKDMKKLPKIDCVGKQDTTSALMWMWSGEGVGRQLYIFNSETRHYKHSGLYLSGAKVTCQVKVEGDVWIGTENKELEVVSRPRVGTPKIIFIKTLKEEPRCMLYQKQQIDIPRVYIGLKGGRLVILDPAESMPAHSKASPFKWREQKTLFVQPKDQLDMPVSCMIIVNQGQELWVGCGHSISIISTKTFMVEERIQAFMQSKLVVGTMVCSGNHAWVVSHKAPLVKEYNTQTREVCSILDCSYNHPLDCNIASPDLPEVDILLESSSSASEADDEREEDGDEEKEEEVSVSMKPLDPPSSPETGEELQADKLRRPGDFATNTVHDLPEPGKSFIKSEHSVTGTTGNESDSEGSSLRLHPPLARSHALRGHTLSNRATTIATPSVLRDVQPLRGRVKSDIICPGLRTTFNSKTRVLSLAIVQDTIWVGRAGGDILVVNVSRKEPHGYDYGRVLAQLTYKDLPEFKGGEIDQLVCVFGDQVIAVRHFVRRPTAEVTADVIAPEECTQLLLWEAYGTDLIHRVHSVWN